MVGAEIDPLPGPGVLGAAGEGAGMEMAVRRLVSAAKRAASGVAWRRRRGRWEERVCGCGQSISLLGVT